MTEVLRAAQWRERARALKEEGWWLTDLCGIDAVGLTRNFPGAEARGPDGAADASSAASVSGGEEGSAGEQRAEGDGPRAAAADSGAQASGLHPASALEMPMHESSRFEIAVQLIHMENEERKSLHVVASGDPPAIPSVTDVWPGSNFMEREAFDMFGIVFEGHPELKRILMPDEWEGYPLRKDYGVGKVAVEFVAQPFLQIDAPGQGPDSEEAKVEVDRLGQVKGVAPRKWGQKQ